MIERWVIDASVAIAWIHPAQATAETGSLRERLKSSDLLIVPVIWFHEIANALLVLERRKKLKPEERRLAMSGLSALNVKADSEGVSRVFGEVSRLAENHALSVYDASYLELAARQRLPLATKDPALKTAANNCGVQL